MAGGGGPGGLSTTCATAQAQKIAAIEDFIHEAGFFLNCGDADGVYNNTVETYKDCIDGCGGCDCKDQANCDCIPANSAIRIAPYVNINDGHCFAANLPAAYDNDTEVIITVTSDSGTSTIYDTQFAYGASVIISPVDITFTEEGKYTITMTVQNCCGTCTITKDLNVGPSLKLTRKTCHTLLFDDRVTHPANTTVKIIVTDVDFKEIDTYTYFNYSSADLKDISLPGDGIYVVDFQTVDLAGATLTTKKFVVYEFCDLIACYDTIVRDYLCDSCDCENENELIDLRNKANQFMTTALAFLGSVDIQYGNTYGMLYYETQYLTTLKNHRVILDQLKKICSDCGITIASTTGKCPTC